ncbi:MetQ/NlpA family ABC transporter substrate-binding protein [Rhodocyclus tenuis]|uniref:Lipoprotein n=1 Tax=Rhodocyclus gracilis TaxID=2929842 RepID=A0ABX0WDL0_9RHOO|nr:MetQ/NlpA family ABC transporter substrate-binding protein [Rhodocyclus gracilis]NJA87752.1 MetQ/NlpA family ABC transporter substrate-binding protein [Rhodocyclus gracilis]
MAFFPSLARRAPQLLLALVAAASFTTSAAEKELKIGVTAGPHAQILEQAKKVAEKQGLKIRIVEFSDYVQPNAALAAGDLDANIFQHQPYLDNQVRDRGYKLVSVGNSVTFPMGVYSKKFKSLADLPAGAQIAIPNDPTNGGRALLLLAAKGLIKLKPDAGLKASPLDIIDNPKKLRLREIDAAQLPRALSDVDAAAINSNFALPAGLNPQKDAILLEEAKSPYVNVIVIREADRNATWLPLLLKAYHSPEVKKYVDTEFKGAVITGW